jgi:F0F1-type ATP synthase assembly protein I
MTVTQPSGARPDGTRPDGAQPDGAQPDGAQPDGAQPDGAQADDVQPPVEAAEAPVPAPPLRHYDPLSARKKARTAAAAQESGAAGPASAGANQGWAVFSYLLAGMAFYGLIGWLIGRVTHLALLFPIGMVFGLAAGITLVILKYGRA